MDQLINIRTPEHIELRYKLAGVGNRFLAFTLDSLLLIGVMTVLWVGVGVVNAWAPGLKSVQTIIVAVAVVISFVIYYGYFLIFETVWNGQTPGKRRLRIRVIRDDGRPINFYEALIRNLMRIVDSFPPFLYAVGSLSIFFSARAKRLGDYVAGTVVIREYAEEAPGFFPLTDAEAAPSSPLGVSLDVGKLSEAESELIGAFLRRRASLDLIRRGPMARRLADGLAQKLGVAPPVEAERFLEQVYEAYQMRNRFLS